MKNQNNQFVVSSFCNLEKQLVECLEFIPYIKNNKNVISPKFIPIILESCTLIESILKETTNSKNSRNNFKIYSKLNESKLELAKTTTIFLSTPVQFLQPYKGWLLQAPKWWLAYNSLKHNRLKSYQYATYENAINSLAALHQLISKTSAFTDYVMEEGWINRQANFIPYLLIARTEYKALPILCIAVESKLFVSPLVLDFVKFQKNGWPIFEPCDFSSRVKIKLSLEGYHIPFQQTNDD